MARMRLKTTQNCVKSCGKCLNDFSSGKLTESRFRSLMYGFSVLLPAVRQSEEIEILKDKIAKIEARLEHAEAQSERTQT